MKIKSFIAYEIESKNEKPEHVYYSPYTRLSPTLWLTSNLEVVHGREFVRKLEEEFQSINGIMHEQLELFDE